MSRRSCVAPYDTLGVKPLTWLHALAVLRSRVHRARKALQLLRRTFRSGGSMFGLLWGLQCTCPHAQPAALHIQTSGMLGLQLTTSTQD